MQLGALNELVLLNLSNNKLSGERRYGTSSISSRTYACVPPTRWQDRCSRSLITCILFFCFAAVLLSAAPIPKELGALTELELLWLNKNELTGEGRGPNLLFRLLEAIPLLEHRSCQRVGE